MSADTGAGAGTDTTKPLDPHLVAILARVSGFTAGWRRGVFAQQVVDALEAGGWEIVRRGEPVEGVTTELHKPQEQH